VGSGARYPAVRRGGGEVFPDGDGENRERKGARKKVGAIGGREVRGGEKRGGGGESTPVGAGERIRMYGFEGNFWGRSEGRGPHWIEDAMERGGISRRLTLRTLGREDRVDLYFRKR